MIRISRFPVMICAQRDGREVRGLLTYSPRTQSVRVGSFDRGSPTVHSRTDRASQRPDPSQILRASLRPPAWLGSFPENWNCSCRRHARCKGTVRRNGTRLLSTIASVFNWRKAPSPGGRTVASQDGRYLFTEIGRAHA